MGGRNKARAQRGCTCLSHSNVLIDSAGTGTDGANDVSVEHDGNTTAEDDYLALVALLDTEQRLAGLSERGQVGRRLVEDPCGRCLVDCKIDAAYQRAVLSQESQQVTTGIDNGNVIGDAQALSLCFCA